MQAIERSERVLVAGLLEVPAVLIAVLLNILSECNRTPLPLLCAFVGGQVFPLVYLAAWSARLRPLVKTVAVLASLLVAAAGYVAWGLASICP